MKNTVTLMLTIATMLVVLEVSAQKTSKKETHAGKYKSARSLFEAMNQEPIQPQKRVNVSNMAGMRKSTYENDTLPSAIIYQSWDEIEEEWFSEERHNYTYINGIYEQQVIVELFVGDELLPYEKQLFYYNNVWELQEVEYYHYLASNNTWELTARDLTHTDTLGNLVLDAYLTFDATNQVWDTLYGTKYDYTYTTFGQPQQIIVSYYETSISGWMYNYMESYVYDSFNRVSVFTESYWDEMVNEFVPEYREEYSYNDQNEWDEVLMYSWFNEVWYLVYMMTDIEWFDFTEKKHLFIMVYMQSLKVQSWEPYARSTAMYHPVLEEQTYLLLEYYVSWMQEWIPGYRETTEFDDNLNFVLFLYEYFDSGDWWVEFGQRNTYVLHAQGLIIEQTVELWDSSITYGWFNWMKMLFEYPHLIGIPVTHNAIDTVLLYPNPIADNAYLFFNQQYPSVLVEVLNSQGQVVMNQLYRSYEMNAPVKLNMCKLQAGIYFVRVHSGGQIQILKAIKK